MTTQPSRTLRHAVPRDVVTGRSVIGYDGSSSALVALQWAAQRALRSGTPLVVLSAADHLRSAHGHPDESSALAEVVWHAVQEVTSEGVALAAAAGAEASPVSVLSDPASALLDASERAESVVVARRGEGGPAVQRLGRVAFSVVDASRSPVVLVRGAPHLPGPAHAVVVGVDGTPSGERAVRFAAAEAAAAGARLVLVAAWQPGGADLPATRDVHHPVVLLEAAERDAETRVRAAARTAREVAPAVAVESRKASGAADLVLSDASAGAGLLVVGARGGAEPRGGRLGGTTVALLSSAPCPVAVIP